MEQMVSDFFALDAQHRREVHFILCGFALEKWEVYSQIPITYQDSVVGMQHHMDTRLPHDAFESSKAGQDEANTAKRYLEPITTIQDDDLELPENIEYAYYAIYNLFCKYVENREIDDWLIVNQALSSEENPSRWAQLFSNAISKTAKFSRG